MRRDAHASYQRRGGRARRAALREGLLCCGRRLGWGARTVIVFTEQLTHRPWKRCTCAELADVLTQLRAVLQALEVRRCTPALTPLRRAKGGAHRAVGA